jgi:hypothetical protein
MSVMGFQHGAVTLEIDALPVISGKHPVSARLLQAALEGSLLIARVGRRSLALVWRGIGWLLARLLLARLLLAGLLLLVW